MLKNYFSIEISDIIPWLPRVVDNIDIKIDWLPEFIYKLAFEIDYSNEINCLNDISYLIGELYSNSYEFENLKTIFEQMKMNLYVRWKWGV